MGLIYSLPYVHNSNLKDLSHTLLTHQRNLVYHHKKGLYQCIRHCHIGADHRGTLARLFSGLDKPRGVWLAGHNCPPETQFKNFNLDTPHSSVPLFNDALKIRDILFNTIHVAQNSEEYTFCIISPYLKGKLKSKICLNDHHVNLFSVLQLLF